MANSYVIISNTGAIGGGKRLIVLSKTWRPSKPAPESFIGGAGDLTVSIGTEGTKWVWEFVGRFQRVGATDYASESDAETWATTTAWSLRSLKFQDVYGVVWDAAWIGPYAPEPYNDDIDGNSEWIKVAVRLRQK